MTRRIDVAPPRTRAWPRRAAAPFPPGGLDAAQALLAEVRALGLAAGDEVLVPAWHLGPAAVALAAAGLVPRFHDLGPRLAPDPDELAALLGPQVRALWLVHHLGFPQDAPGWLAWCRQRGLLLLEDATAAPLATPGDAAARRRANYRILLAELTRQVPTPFARLPEGAVPLVLPVEADDRAALLRRLDRHRVGALDFRAGLPPGLPEGRFPNAARLATRTVGLPVHQRLRPRDLDRIAAAARTRPRRPAELTLELAEELGPLRPLWTKLAERGRNLFGTWEWAATWWRHHGQGRPLRVIVVRRAGEPVGLLPLYRWRSRPLAVLRFLGHGPADELGPVGDPDDGVLLARALRRSLLRLDADLLLAEQLPRGQDWGALLGGRRLAAEASPVVCFGAGGWEAYLAARSANFREQVRRRARKLAREHPVGYRLSDGSHDLDRDLDTLFRLHAARWADAPTNFLAEEVFHRAFAPVAAGRGWLRLWFLEVDGQAVAALYGFRYAGTESYYQAGRDPAWSHQRIGFVLLAHAIRQAAQDGVAEYRLLRGGEDYKQRFAIADPGLETVALARGSLAGAALPALTAARAAPGPLGRLARRAGAGALHR